MWRVLLFLGCLLRLDAFPFSKSKGTVEDLVIPQGYPVEHHVVRTADGYNLGVYRISHGRVAPFAESRRPVVLLQHGLLDTCAAFLMNGVEGSLGFILADVGFDVWLGNSRGSTFSDFNLQSRMTEATFWDFSLDELIQYDMPATVGHVLDRTKAEKIIYIGHSQGTAIAHAWFSTHHPLTYRIAVAIMMAPVTYVKHITSIFLRALARMDLENLFQLLGMHKFLPNSKNIHLIMGPVCRELDHGCADVLSLIVGYNPNNIDKNRFDTYLTYSPAGSSVKQMAHWIQHVKMKIDNQFQEFDYGKQCFSWRLLRRRKCNQSVYGSKTPPIYDMGAIEVPLVFFHGGHDTLADVLDVATLKETLSEGVLREEHLRLEYTHLDFTWGIDAPEYVYDRIVSIMQEMHRNGTLSGGGQYIGLVDVDDRNREAPRNVSGCHSPGNVIS